MRAPPLMLPLPPRASTPPTPQPSPSYATSSVESSSKRPTHDPPRPRGCRPTHPRPTRHGRKRRTHPLLRPRDIPLEVSSFPCALSFSARLRRYSPNPRGEHMRLRTILGTTAATLLLLGAGVGSAQAGEVNGKGGDTQGPAHANSICVYSGLADGGEGEPAGPGAPPQNWG